jgi:hypothetical protein
MSTFDGTTTRPPGADPSAPPSYDTDPDEASGADPLRHLVPQPEPEFDALANLQQQMQARDEIDTTIKIDIPGLGWRLVCETDLPYQSYARWQKISFPRAQRNGRKVNPLDLDRALLSTFVLLGTCVGMEYRERGDGDWVPMLDSRQQPMSPNSREMMDRFGQVDEKVFLRKLFKTDAALTRAGTKVTEAAGWTDDEADDDPTEQG